MSLAGYPTRPRVHPEAEASGIPTPVSATAITTCPSRDSAVTVIRPPFGVAQEFKYKTRRRLSIYL